MGQALLPPKIGTRSGKRVPSLSDPIPFVQEAKHVGELRYSDHVLRRLIERGITTDTVEEALDSPRVAVLENYLDQPSPSCMLLGWDYRQTPYHIHVVHDTIVVITVYVPTPPKWVDPWTRGG